MKWPFLLFFVVISVGYSGSIGAYTFKEAISALENHALIEEQRMAAQSLHEKGDEEGSWGDPTFRLAFKNFPRDTLERDQTPMTGIEFGISQNLALTPKYGRKEEAFKAKGESLNMQAENQRRKLIKNFWQSLLDIRQLEEKREIFKENKDWITKILKVSKRLYANGRISQQALLEIQIRKTEIETQLSNLGFEVDDRQEHLSYLISFKKGKLDKKTIPWSTLENRKEKGDLKDFQEKGLEMELKASEKMLSAKRLNIVPDVQLSLGYTKRSNIDNNGDFVSAMVSFPMPFSGKKYAGKAEAYYQKEKQRKQLENYKLYKRSQSERLQLNVNKIQGELNILEKKTIRFAENSRKVTSKSYSLGNSTYIELLQAELKLQELQIKRIKLRHEMDLSRLELKFLIGEPLYDKNS